MTKLEELFEAYDCHPDIIKDVRAYNAARYGPLIEISKIVGIQKKPAIFNSEGSRGCSKGRRRMRDYTPIIPKSQLIDGAYYKGVCRHATVARWSTKDQKFYHWRDKFTSHFIESICAPEDDTVFDVFVANKIITDLSEIERIPFPHDQEIKTGVTV